MSVEQTAAQGPSCVQWGVGCLFLPHKLNARAPKDVCTLIWLCGAIVPSQQLADSISPETAQVATLPSVGPRCR